MKSGFLGREEGYALQEKADEPLPGCRCQECKAIKQGVPDGSEGQPNKVPQKDREDRCAKTQGKSVFLITRRTWGPTAGRTWSGTLRSSASVHNSQVIDVFLDDNDTYAVVWANSACWPGEER
ncbi:hypothetical protein SAMN05444515_10248 [Ectothiorhodospira marina]|uniref:Uncharacterized protein n=1 Tax=Ectothiorhodospira marina TaxID=1396821 RepID=A0A1H7H2B7_9GAMM|nr:hypothetical protein SAMN05444515_10248 [Ectothiorhodospira marina]